MGLLGTRQKILRDQESGSRAGGSRLEQRKFSSHILNLTSMKRKHKGDTELGRRTADHAKGLTRTRSTQGRLGAYSRDGQAFPCLPWAAGKGLA